MGSDAPPSVSTDPSDARMLDTADPLYPSSIMPATADPVVEIGKGVTSDVVNLPQQVPETETTLNGLDHQLGANLSPRLQISNSSDATTPQSQNGTVVQKNSSMKEMSSGRFVKKLVTRTTFGGNNDAYFQKMGTFRLTKDDLLDNACAEALQQMRRGHSDLSLDSHNIDQIISHGRTVMLDWTLAYNLERLRDLCRFIKRLFWAFSEEEAGLNLAHPQVSKACQYTGLVLKSDVVGVFFSLLTVYALFGPDILAIAGYTAAYNTPIAIVNTVAVLLFFLEAALNSWVTAGYFCSGNFWIDIFATCTMIGDTWVATELVQSDATMAARGTRVAKLLRVGGRSSRFVRLVRVARAVQVLRLIPRIQRWLEKSTHELALALLHKRLWHLFKYLDHHHGYLSDVDEEFLYAAMQVQFPERKDEVAHASYQLLPEVWGKLHEVSDSIMKHSSHATSAVKSKAKNIVHVIGRSDDADKNEEGSDGTFPSVVSTIMSLPIGKRAFHQCVNDIQAMKDSSLLLDKSINRITLKVCIIVLSLIIVIPLMESNVEDATAAQILSNLDLTTRTELTTEVNGQKFVDMDTFCTLTRPTANWVPRNVLHLLIVDYRVNWDLATDCHCCDFQGATLSNGDEVMRFVDQRMAFTNVEPSMLTVHCLPDASCMSNDIRSVIVHDNREETKYLAEMSLIYTSIVVVIMIILVMFFAVEMKRISNHNLFHPLWDLLDDMCALKCMEVVAGGNRCGEGPPSMGTVTATNKATHRKCMERCSSSDPPLVSEELRALRNSFVHLRGAILSWGKYVPTILLKQLYEAGIEAQIGCKRTDVTVFFCDIENFKDLCDNKSPQEVLEILGKVLERISDVIEEKQGVLLEFIGDEVMACFNAPAKVEDHTKLAVSAAAEILEATSDINFGPVVQCGVHRANVLAGNLGSPTRMKFGLMGDGVNLTARLKSLNTRYGTQLLVSSLALDFEAAHELMVTRPIGNLVLKGRTTPTSVFEVLGKRTSVVERIAEGASKHTEAFKLFCNKEFEEARRLFMEAHDLLSLPDGGDGAGDRPSMHLHKLCDQYLATPPPASWDGSEYLTKKAWN